MVVFSVEIETECIGLHLVCLIFWQRKWQGFAGLLAG
jgi:hypothetical protein